MKNQKLIAEKVAKYHRANLAIKALEATLEKTKQQIKDLLGEYGSYSVDCDCDKFTVNFIESSRTSLDKNEILKDMGGDFVNKYSKVATFDKLSVTLLQNMKTLADQHGTGIMWKIKRAQWRTKFRKSRTDKSAH
jgi:hypothetical protein